MASGPYIYQPSVTPSECNNLSSLHLAMVVKDDTDAILTSGVTATAIITREDETAITASPITLSAAVGKYSADSTLTQQAGVGRLKVVFKAVYNSIPAYSLPVYVTIKGRMGSLY